jgi:hypothetical protein
MRQIHETEIISHKTWLCKWTMNTHLKNILRIFLMDAVRSSSSFYCSGRDFKARSLGNVFSSRLKWTIFRIRFTSRLFDADEEQRKNERIMHKTLLRDLLANAHFNASPRRRSYPFCWRQKKERKKTNQPSYPFRNIFFLLQEEEESSRMQMRILRWLWSFCLSVHSRRSFWEWEYKKFSSGGNFFLPSPLGKDANGGWKKRLESMHEILF